MDLADLPADRLVRVDCHVHSYRSGDSRTSIERIEESAISAGLDVVCITDHGTVAGGFEALEAFTEVAVVVGQECRTWAGEIIGLFLTERIPGNLQPEAVVDAIHDQGGLVYLPHPFCAMHNGLRPQFIDQLSARVDIVEIHNAKATADGNAKALDFARGADIAPGVGSDAHYAEFVGRAFIELPAFDGPAAFLAALRSPDATVEPGTYSHGEATWPVRR